MATVSKKILWGSSSTDYITVTMDDAVQDQIIKVDSTDNPSSSARSKSVILSTSSDSSVTASLNVMQAAGGIPVGTTLGLFPKMPNQSLKGRDVRVQFYNQTRGKSYLTTRVFPLNSTDGGFTFTESTGVAASTIFNNISAVDGDVIYAELYTQDLVLLGSSVSTPTTIYLSLTDPMCNYSHAFSLYDLDCGNTLDFDVTFYDSYSYLTDTTIGGSGTGMVSIPISGGNELIDFEAPAGVVGQTIQFVAGPNTADEVIASYQIDAVGTHTWSIPQSTIQEIIDATGSTQVELRYLSYPIHPNRIVNFTVQGFYSVNGSASSPVPSDCTVTINYMNVDGKSITVRGTTDSQGFVAFRRADVAKVSQQVVATVTPPLLVANKGTTTLSINATVTKVDFAVMCEYVVS